mmetsp:Transcript_6557/g.14286  ORF Transcript_6557/g.14286 Transcript_6557/m.14286 type:complete len:219 (+) Transcript_6557:1353-2009(+)
MICLSISVFPSVFLLPFPVTISVSWDSVMSADVSSLKDSFLTMGANDRRHKERRRRGRGGVAITGRESRAAHAAPAPESMATADDSAVSPEAMPTEGDIRAAGGGTLEGDAAADDVAVAGEVSATGRNSLTAHTSSAPRSVVTADGSADGSEATPTAGEVLAANGGAPKTNSASYGVAEGGDVSTAGRNSSGASAPRSIATADDSVVGPEATPTAGDV